MKLLTIIFFFLFMGGILPSSGKQRPRVYILTDISSLKSGVGEPDDTQSLIRFLLYANEFQIEGIGATYTSHGDTIYPRLIKEVIQIYGYSLQSLNQHGTYPKSEDLISNIKKGNPHKGINEIGEGKDTELSAHLIETLKKETESPLWVLIWGGALDLAQSLWRINQTFPKNEAEKLIRKLRVYSIADQYDNSGEWIRNNFKELFYILNKWSFRGMYRTGDTELVSADWVQQHVLSNPAPLARLYPCYKGEDPWGKVYGIKEGDSPSFLYLLPQSPGNPERPEEEHWGGSFQRIAGTRHYTDGTKEKSLQYAPSVSKWRKDFQLDFVTRLSWLNYH